VPKYPSAAVVFTHSLSNILSMQWDGTVCTEKTGQVAKISPPPLTSNSYYRCLQSHLESPENPTVSIVLLSHSSACLLAQQLDLLPSPTLTLCPHLLLLNPISPPIIYAPDCLRSLPPKEPHIPSPLAWGRCKKVTPFHHQCQPLSMLPHFSKKKNRGRLYFTFLGHPD